MAQTTLKQRQVSGGLDGWIPAEETWTYAEVNTFTISGDKTGKYQMGDKVKLTQTTVKYFYIKSVSYSSPNTTVVLYAGSDYTVANATITSPYFSKIENPQGFPHWFNYTPTFGGFSGTPDSISQFRMQGNNVTVFIRMISATSNANTFTISCPIPALTLTNYLELLNDANAVNNSAAVGATARATALVTSGSTAITMQLDGSSTGWATSNSKRANITFTYRV